MPEWQDMWCRKHSAPFRERWPEGSLLAIVMMFQFSASDERVQRVAGNNADNLSITLKVLSPLCCLLGDEITRKITTAALSGQMIKPEGL